MNLFEKFAHGLAHDAFLDRHANPSSLARWRAVHAQVTLTPEQRQLLGSFRRQMSVLCLAGTWCGDCINQCPIFDHFARAAAVINLRFLDRDAHPDAQRALRINGGDRIPVLVFFSEDGEEVCRYGERTLGKYRQMMREQAGPSCPTGIHAPGDDLLPRVVQDWLDEFERVQWLLRLSPRLRQKHGD